MRRFTILFSIVFFTSLFLVPTAEAQRWRRSPPPQANPSAPTLTATGGLREVKLSWTVPSSGNSPLSAFRIYREFAGQPQVVIRTVSSGLTSYTDDEFKVNPNLRLGITYYYTVRAINQAGLEGDPSNLVGAVPVAQQLSAPGAPTLSAVWDSVGRVVRLSWQPPSFPGNPSFTSYDILRVDTQSGFVTQLPGWQGLPNNNRFYNDFSPQSGKTYSYTVGARNSVGRGASNEVRVTVAGPLSAPQNFTATFFQVVDSGVSKVVLKWQPPGSDGGFPIRGYRIYSPSGPISVGNILTYTVDLRGGSYQIAAFNDRGEGPRSSANIQGPPRLSAPQEFTATPVPSRVTLNWRAPQFGADSPGLKYRIYRDGAVVGIIDGNVLTYTDTGLTNGRQYSYRVLSSRAIEGTTLLSPGDGTSPVQATPKIEPPTPPQNLKGTPGNAKVTLTWQAPVSDGGAPIISYLIYRCTEGQYLGLIPPNQRYCHQTGVAGNVLDYVDTGFTVGKLLNGGVYEYEVSAVNTVSHGGFSFGGGAVVGGESQRSNKVTVQPLPPPAAPTGLKGFSGKEKITLNWGPAINNGSAVTKYNIYRRDAAGERVFTAGPTVISYTDIANLIAGTTYTYQVSAESAMGEGPRSNELVIKKAITFPGAPALSAKREIDKNILSWQAPASDGGSPLKGYNIFRSDKSFNNINEAGVRSIASAGVLDGTIGDWSETNSLTSPLYQAASAVGNGYVYVLGGSDSLRSQSVVSYAKINPDGTLERFFKTTDLPTPRWNHTAFSANDHVFVIGGNNSDVLSAKINPDGSLGDWKKVSTLSITQHSSVAVGGYVYVVGGGNNSTVYYTRVNSDGTLGAWATTSSLPESRYEHKTVADSGYIYTIGGYDNNNRASAKVFYAKINSDGMLGDWAETTQFWYAALYHGSVAVNGYVYVIGGLGNNILQPGAFYAKINPADGKLSEWRRTEFMPSGLEYHSAAIHNGYLYVIGGTAGVGPRTKVLYAQIKNFQPTYDDLETVPGVTYHYRVSAYNSVGSGPLSNEAAAAIVNVPSAPANLTAAQVPGSSKIILSWRPQDNGGSPLTAYNIYRGLAPDQEEEIPVGTADPAATTFTDVDLAGRTYHYRITAVNAVGESRPSDEASASIAVTPPGGPTDLSATFLENKFTLNWKAPASDGGSPIIGYKIYRGTASNQQETAPHGQINAFEGNLGAWDRSASLPSELTGHSSLAANGYLYIIGGTKPGAGAQFKVFYAKVNPDGSLGEVAETNPLPLARYGHSAAAFNGYIYVVGGYDATSKAQNGGFYSRINSNGTLGDWLPIPSLPEARTEHSLTAAGGSLYLVGGHAGNPSFPRATVYYSRLRSNGSPSIWLETQPLSNSVLSDRGGRERHSSFAANGYLYAVGGYSNNGYQSTVLYAKIDSDGTLGSWRDDSASLPAAVAAPAVTANNYAYVMGGANRSGGSDKVYYGELDRNTGEVGEWFTNSESLPAPLSGHAAVTVNGYIYAVSGEKNAAIYSSKIEGIGTSYIDLGFSTDRTYYYKVSALNAAEKTMGREEFSTAAIALLSKPQNLTAKAGNTEITVGWQAPANDGGLPIKSYKIYRDNVQIAEVGGDALALAYTDTSLTNEEGYSYQVRAVNAIGEGPLSDAVSATPENAARVFVTSASYNGNLGDLAGADSKCQVRANEAKLGGTWKAWLSGRDPRNDTIISADSRLTHFPGPYKLLDGTLLANDWTDLTGGVLSAPINVTELGTTRDSGVWLEPTIGNLATPFKSPDCTYWGQTAGLTQGGAGNLATTENFWKAKSKASCNETFALYCFEQIIGVPTAPQSAAAVPGIGKVVLSWQAPDYDGGSDISKYKIYRDNTSVGEVDGNVLTYPDTGLTAGASYTYKISAVNAKDEGAGAEVGAKLAARPQEPIFLTAAPANTTVTLSWKAPVWDGGSRITKYKIYRNNASIGEVDGNVLTYPDTGLTNGVTYIYKVSAVSEGAGEGQLSSAVSVKPSVLPGEPQNLTAKAGNGQVTLKWQPAATTDLPISNYKIYMREAYEENYKFQQMVPVQAAGFPVTINLINGRTYYFQVSSFNLSGAESNPTKEVTAKPENAARVFVTSENITGFRLQTRAGTNSAFSVVFPDAADNFCRQRADTAGLGGIWKAWLSSWGNASASSRLVHFNNGPYKRLDGVIVANSWKDLAVSRDKRWVENILLAPINIDEFGNRRITNVWSFTFVDGTSNLTTDFGSGDVYFMGKFVDAIIYGKSDRQGSAKQRGYSDATDEGWTNDWGVSYLRGDAQALYCFEQIYADSDPTLPTAPLSFVAFPGVNQVTLSWQAPAENAGSQITKYRIYRDGNLLPEVGGSTLTHLDTGLTNGQVYRYHVAAVNRAGKEGYRSSEVSAKPDNMARVFVTSTDYDGNLGGISGADNKCQARADDGKLGGNWKSWLATERCTNCPVFGFFETQKYEISYSPEKNLPHFNGPYRLLNGDLIANNWTDLTSGTLINPINVTELGTTKESKVWTNVGVGGSVRNVDYSGQCNEWSYNGSEVRGGTGNTTAGDGRWTNEFDYYYGINPGTTAFMPNSSSCDQKLPLYCFEQISGVSMAPHTVVAKPEPAQVTLTWKAPQNDGGSPPSEYRIYRGTASGQLGTISVATVAGNILTYTDPRLVGETTYYYQISAVNKGGEGDKSAEVSVKTLPAPTVTNLKAVWNPNLREARLTWDPPSNVDFDGFKIYRSENPGDEALMPLPIELQSSPTAVKTYTDTNIEKGPIYYYKVRSYIAGERQLSREALEKTFSNEVSIDTATIPGVPTLEAIAGEGKITLVWRPGDTGGKPILDHVINPGNIRLDGKTTSYTIHYQTEELKAPITYTFSVYAVNEIGRGPVSNSVSATPRHLSGVWEDVVGEGNAGESCNEWLIRTGQDGKRTRTIKVNAQIAQGPSLGKALQLASITEEDISGVRPTPPLPPPPPSPILTPPPTPTLAPPKPPTFEPSPSINWSNVISTAPTGIGTGPGGPRITVYEVPSYWRKVDYGIISDVSKAPQRVRDIEAFIKSDFERQIQQQGALPTPPPAPPAPPPPPPPPLPPPVVSESQCVYEQAAHKEYLKPETCAGSRVSPSGWLGWIASCSYYPYSQEIFKRWANFKDLGYLAPSFDGPVRQYSIKPLSVDDAALRAELTSLRRAFDIFTPRAIRTQLRNGGAGGIPVERTQILKDPGPSIRVSKGSSGTGTITGTGIKCGATCDTTTTNYVKGDTYTFTATPDPGSRFTSWAGDCRFAGTNPTCTIVMDGDKIITAHFDAIQTINVYVGALGKGGSVAVSPAGASCVPAAVGCFRYNDGDTVTFSAVDTETVKFINWGQACAGSGTSPFCSIRVTPDNPDTDVHEDFVFARFEPRPSLRIVKPGPQLINPSNKGDGTVTTVVGTGINCGSDCVAAYDPIPVQTVKLKAAADQNSVFNGWSGPDAGICAVESRKTEDCEVEVSKDKTIIANFVLKNFTLNVAPSTNGTVRIAKVGDLITYEYCRDGCEGNEGKTYDINTRVELIAEPDYSYILSAWGGDCAGTSASEPCVLTINGNKSVSATFAKKVTLTATRPDNGKISGTGIDCGSGKYNCEKSFAPGASVTLKAEVTAGNVFIGWAGGTSCDGSMSDCNLIMDADKRISANIIPRPALTVAVSGDGTVTGPNIDCEPVCSSKYNYKESVRLVAIPDTAASTFTGWSGIGVDSCGGKLGACYLTMDQSRSVSAAFEKSSNIRTLNVSSSGKGTVKSADKKVDCASCVASYGRNAKVILDAVPDAVSDSGWKFVRWIGGNCDKGSCALVMTTDQSIIAEFQEIDPQKKITIRTSTGGSVQRSGLDCGSNSTCQTSYSLNLGSVTFNAVPNSGYTFTGWSGSGAANCQAVFPNLPPTSCSVQLDSDKELTANFVQTSSLKQIQIVTADLNGPGSITGPRINCRSDCEETYLPSETSITLNAVTNSELTGWTLDAVSCAKNTACPINFENRQAGAIVRVGATFKSFPTSRSLTVYTKGSGSVTWLVNRINCASNSNTGCLVDIPITELTSMSNKITLTAIPDTATGAQLLGWKVEGVSVCGKSWTCEITMNSDKSVEAEFSIPKLKTLVVNRTGSGTITDGSGLNCPLTAADCKARYPSSVSKVTISATPADGWEFVGWSEAGTEDVCGSTATGCQVTLSPTQLQTSVEAVFRSSADVSKLAVSIVGQGTVKESTRLDCVSTQTTFACQTVNYIKNTSINLEAVPVGPDWTWSWSVPGCGSNTRFCAVTMDSDREDVAVTFQSVVVTPQVTLKVTKDGFGNGTITGPNFSCPPTCENILFDKNELIKINANPNPLDSVFAGWSGDVGTAGTGALGGGTLGQGGALGGCTTLLSCDLTMNNSKTVIAKFNKKSLVRVAKTGLGTVTSTDRTKINCGTNCSEYIDPGTTDFELIATPDSGQPFLGWEGACGGVTICKPPLTTEVVDVKAKFKEPQGIATLSITRVPENGFVKITALGKDDFCPPALNCSKQFVIGTDVLLSATGDPNWTFDGWDGADLGTCVGTKVDCPVKMDKSRSAFAKFDGSRAVKTLSIVKSGRGTVQSVLVSDINCGSQCSRSYAPGSKVTLHATGDRNYTFMGWAGDVGICRGRTDDCLLTLDNKLTQESVVNVTAAFELSADLKKLRVTKPTSGTIAGENVNCGRGGDDCEAFYKTGGEVILSAFSAPGYQSAGWLERGTQICSGDFCRLKMDTDRQISVNFAPVSNLRTLNIYKVNTGTVTSKDGKINCVGTQFCSSSYSPDTKVILDARVIDAVNFYFAGWTGKGSELCGTKPDCEVILSENLDITANFTPVSASQLLIISPQVGGFVSAATPGQTTIVCRSTTPLTCQKSYTGSQKQVTLHAEADTVAGYNFDGWSGDVGDCAGQGQTRECLMNRTRVVGVSFSKEQATLAIQVKNTPNGNGTVVIIEPEPPRDCSTGCSNLLYPKNTEVLIRAIPASGSLLKSWSNNCKVDPTKPNECRLIMDKNILVVTGFQIPVPKVFDVFRADVIRELNPLKLVPQIRKQAIKILQNSKDDKSKKDDEKGDLLKGTRQESN